MMAEVSVAAGSDQSVGLLARQSGDGEGSGYLAEMYGAPGVNGVVVNLFRRSGGKLTRLNTTTTAVGVGRLEFSLTGSSLSVYMNDVLLLSARDTLLERGSVGLRLSGTAGAISVGFFASNGKPRPAPVDTFNGDPVRNGIIGGLNPWDRPSVTNVGSVTGGGRITGSSLPFNLPLDRP